MALPLHRLVFPQGCIEVCKPRLNNQQIKTKSRQQHLTRVSQTDSPLAITYQPTMWNDDYIQALDDNFPINFKEKVWELEKKVRASNMGFEKGTLEWLEHIDDIERLGLGYRFQNDIKRVLKIITSVYGHEEKEENLHYACLKFRILRQHGYNVSQDFLRRFKDGHGAFIGCLQTDVKGLISLYEASHLAFVEESDLYEAKLFAIGHLQQLKHQENDLEVLEHINDSLEVPLYHQMLRLQARQYIDAYKKREDANPLLLELATLDFNMTQATFKAEVKELSKWWKNIGLAHRLGFVRDRLMECFFWSVGMVFEPQYHSCRVWLTKICMLITVIDDIYDVYGSVDELQVLTDVVNRWDFDAIEYMPMYSQLAFEALHKTVSEIRHNSLIGQADDITSMLRKVWGELLEAFLVEAKWTQDKYMPTLQIYLDNAWRSVSGVVLLTHGYFLINQKVEKDVVEYLEKYQDLMKWSSMLFRLYNDLATSSDEIKRGKSVNVISCYMHEKCVCEKDAREYVTTLIDEAWRKLIEAHVICSQEMANPSIDMAINLARIAQCMYQYGDGVGAPNAQHKSRVLSVIIDPVHIIIK